MKKILLLILASCIPFFSVVNTVSAADTKVTVTEKVPGAECTYAKGVDINTPVEKRQYECSVKSGLEGFQNLFATIIRWMINIVLLTAVLAIIGLGIAWSLAGGDDAKAKSSLKKWGINVLV